MLLYMSDRRLAQRQLLEADSPPPVHAATSLVQVVTDRDIAANVRKRLALAEDQLAGVIADHYRADGTNYDATARAAVENPLFRLWLGVLAGYDLEFLQGSFAPELAPTEES